MGLSSNENKALRALKNLLTEKYNILDLRIYGSISGTVSKSDSNTLSDVIIKLTCNDIILYDTTDMAGKYDFQQLTVGTYYLYAQKVAYLSNPQYRIVYITSAGTNPSIDFIMEEAIAAVKTVEITRAVRDVQIKGLKIKKGQAIGIVDDKDIVAAGDDDGDVLFKAIGKVDIGSAEVVTIYYGASVDASKAELIAQQIRDEYLGKQVEAVAGNQPHYSYIVSLE